MILDFKELLFYTQALHLQTQWDKNNFFFPGTAEIFHSYSNL